ncbi:MAG TPA: alkaline phosphatase family protein [Thermoplasmata archaeon]|nr:alkaline phosphatase family protein [Thermoplasmata archaeon]
MGRPFRRFLVLGLDGGTFDLLDPLMQAGELPYLQSLVHRGVRAPLRSVYPAKTIPAWYSFATGKDPGELGIFGFTEPDGGPGHSRLVQTFRPAEAFWDTLSRIGVKVGVVNFPFRAPYPLHGFVVPGMFSGATTTYPLAVKDEIHQVLGEEYPLELPVFRDADRSEWVARATRAVEQRAKVAAALAERHRPGFLFALFRETDRIEHQLWSELGRPVAEIPSDLLGFWRTVDRACKRVDDAFRSGGGPAVTLVISDHGHGPIQSDFLTNRWLAEQDFLFFQGGSDASRRTAVGRLLLYLHKVPLAQRLLTPFVDFVRDGQRARIAEFLGGATSFEEFAKRIDWRRTVAFSYPVPEGIYLNPNNPDLTPERREVLRNEIRRRLEAYPDAHIEVLDPRTLYRGRNLALAPALFIRVDNMCTEPRMDFGYPTPLIRDRPSYFYGSGTHRMNGILIGAGDGIRPGADMGTLDLVDVAPTILDGMGCELSDEMADRSFGRRMGFTG